MNNNMVIMKIDKVHITQDIYDIMMDFAKENPRNEVLGIFFGLQTNDHKLEITNAYPFRVGKHKEVQFCDEDYEQAYPIIKSCAQKNLKWLGWFHSHPFKHGDHLYMSSTDVMYHFSAQSQNPFWTALILNPHQIHDQNTTRGMRAFQLNYTHTQQLTRQVREIQIILL